MFLCAFILILSLPVAFLSLALEDFFSSEELTAMGIACRKHDLSNAEFSDSNPCVDQRLWFDLETTSVH